MIDLSKNYGGCFSPVAMKAGEVAARRQFQDRGDRGEIHLCEETLAIVVAAAVEGVLAALKDAHILAASPTAGRPS